MEESDDKIVENPVAKVPKVKLQRCMEWLQSQNELRHVSSDKDDVQLVAVLKETCENFKTSVAEDETTVPAGVDEDPAKPKAVVNY